MATLPETTPTTNAGAGDQGTNAATRTFIQTQSTSDYETGFEGSVRQDPSANDDTGGVGQGAISPTSTGVGQYDDATGGAGTNVDQALGDDAGASYGGYSQAENDALNQALKTQTGSFTTDGSNQQIIPQDNILDKFSSYTYRASWYLMTPAQYKQLVYSKKKVVNGYMLLVQSGGAPQNSGGFKGALSSNTQTFYENNGSSSTNASIPGAAEPDAGRNPAFPLDFYIDSVTIENFLTGSGTRAPHAIKNLKFTVIENNGITLLDRLYEAVQDFMPATGQNQPINYAAVTYLMVIRFYGYDEQGKLVTRIGGNKSDPNAVIEKFIPFKIGKCDWTVENKLVTYSFEALSPGVGAGAGTRRGTIPYNIELTATTIESLLGQDVIYSSAQAAAGTPGAATTLSTPDQSDAETRRLLAANAAAAPPKADAAPTTKRGITQGLMGAMNQYQRNLVDEGVTGKFV